MGDAFNEFIEQRRRGLILRVLQNSGERGAALQTVRTLVGRFYPAPSDTFNIDIAWLHEHLMLRKRAIGEVTMLTITERGSDVDRGDRSVPGIERADLDL